MPLERFPPGVGGPRDADELLWVGSRGEHKGIETLLRATAIARRERPALHLRLVGPATQAQDSRWTALAIELGIAETTTFEGAAGREAVAEAMRRAGVFVHPSPWETFGVVAAEAIASGLPVAATPSGGVEEIVGVDGRFGEIATGRDPEALAAAIVRLRDRADAIDRTGFRDDIVARFGPEAVVARTFEVYDHARSSPATPASRPRPRRRGRLPRRHRTLRPSRRWSSPRARPPRPASRPSRMDRSASASSARHRRHRDPVWPGG